MSAIAGEHTETAPTSALTRQRLKWLMYAALAGLLTLAAARYGYEWWSVGRFVESTDDAYAGGNVTPISPHVAGFVAQILIADNEYVRAGQPLIRLDDRGFRAAVDRATAIVAARQATLDSLQRKQTLQQTLSARQRPTSTQRRRRRHSPSRTTKGIETLRRLPPDRGKTRRG